MDRVGSGQGQVEGTCEYGDEPSGSKNAGNFLTSCRTSQLLKKDSAPWSKLVCLPAVLVENCISEPESHLTTLHTSISSENNVI